MKKRTLAAVFAMTVLLMLNAGSIFNCLIQEKRLSLISRRSQLVHAIKPGLADLENRLWGIISVYDPGQGRKVGLEDLAYAEPMNAMMRSIEQAEAMTGNDTPLTLQLDILMRSVKALYKRIGAIKDRLDMKKMDEEAAEVLFPDSPHRYLLSESYVDELKTLLEHVRMARRVIENNISVYDELEMRMLGTETKTVSLTNRRWLLVNGAALLALAVLFAISFRETPARPEGASL